MKAEQVYQHLKELAEKLGIEVSEKNFRQTGFHVHSGLCRVKERNVFLMDKHKTLDEKVELLAECLGRMATDDFYVVPTVRELLDQYQQRKDVKDQPDPADAEKRAVVLKSINPD